MTKADPYKLIQQALDDDIVPLGEYQARRDADSFKTTYPTIAAEFNEVDNNTTFDMYLDQKTGATVIIPSEQNNE